MNQLQPIKIQHILQQTVYTKTVTHNFERIL